MEMITNAGPGKSKFTLMHDYDDHLKLHHRLLSPSLGVIAAPQYQPLMEVENTQLLNDLLELSDKTDTKVSTTAIYPLLERTQTSVILALHYGLRIPKFEEPILHEVVHVQQQVTHRAANPLLPDMLPALRHLPRFLSPWQQDADRLYAEQLDLYMRLYNHGKDCPGWNATKQALSVAKKQAPEGVPDVDLAFTLATSIQGGMETSPRQILWLFVAGLIHSGWWAKAQSVLDEVVGRDRLPQFSDRLRPLTPKLPWNQRISKENGAFEFVLPLEIWHYIFFFLTQCPDPQSVSRYDPFYEWHQLGAFPGYSVWDPPMARISPISQLARTLSSV